ncbi:uncharacterized protein TNIN_10181 [Trichonephila inaurata madagascariensis]|uniref:Uncharacterized protein n=1 Tax=Trichonephila inaurata madagascariensis TaxID=2747483 RepID=A0A8X6WTG4_9ARAC|nr:uncharacterized protein TNIN_10181 [Trichonephila inaurata madagascariensis]
MNLGSLFHAVERGDLQSLDKQIGNDENLLRSKNADGSTVMHHAVLHDQLNVVNYFLDKYPALLNVKDRNGRTPLHVAGQQKNQYLYTILATSGADPMILDQKGRTAEFYMNSSTKPTVRPHISPQSSSPENDSSGEKSSLSPEECPKEEEPTKETVEQKTPTSPKEDTPQTEETDDKDDKPEKDREQRHLHFAMVQTGISWGSLLLLEFHFQGQCRCCFFVAVSVMSKERQYLRKARVDVDGVILTAQKSLSFSCEEG